MSLASIPSLSVCQYFIPSVINRERIDIVFLLSLHDMKKKNHDNMHSNLQPLELKKKKEVKLSANSTCSLFFFYIEISADVILCHLHGILKNPANHWILKMLNDSTAKKINKYKNYV